ncbi:TraR/DksA family transcriptional regulator [Candidatus Cytomitobacter primus]|uniref:TraR/DksA family transcriptional regulator n=1 Tax=Candidatus Cytomitobacter primus TaxID=2066024 RepID=A0A5C0UH71_9PROT|nr:TraR/DksA family transcriptional regulator [Candidatus Cytomitobacter primus]QEK38394.1 TraR/DksA family transcriptional regulator [Candidatus Cytomitobacter primus]
MNKLDKKTILAFKVKLEKMKHELTIEIQQNASQYYKERSSEELEHITNSLNDEIFIAEQNKKAEMLKQIQFALLRIKNGVYGICPKTGELINIARLKANPTALCNIKSQPNQEKNFTYSRHFNNI